MSGLTNARLPTIELDFEALAAGLTAHASERDRDAEVPAHGYLELAQLSQPSDLLRLCELLGESRSLGVVLRVLGPMLAAEAALECNLPVAQGRLTACAPWFASDAVSLSFRDDAYVVSGSCQAVVDPLACDELLVWAGGQRYALVPLSAAGIRCEPRLGSTGLSAAALASVRLDEVRVSPERVSALPAAAFESLRVRHLSLFARALCSFSHALLDGTLLFVGSRPFRGGVLSDAAVVRHRLAELRVFPRLFSAQTALAACSGEQQALRSLLLAETLSEALPTFIKQCQQLHGGRGFLMESCVARAYQDLLELPRLLGPRAQLRSNNPRQNTA